MAQNATLSDDQVEKVVTLVHPYTLVVVADGHMGPLGGVTWKDEPTVRASITLKDAKGSTYAPLAESKLSADAKNLLQIMKPMIANMMGPMGQNMWFVAFPGTNADGQPFADPTKEGLLTVSLDDREFKFPLPLASLLPAKYDSSTGEKFPGNYNYNPITGSKLVTTKPNP